MFITTNSDGAKLIRIAMETKNCYKVVHFAIMMFFSCTRYMEIIIWQGNYCMIIIFCAKLLLRQFVFGDLDEYRGFKTPFNGSFSWVCDWCLWEAWGNHISRTICKRSFRTSQSFPFFGLYPFKKAFFVKIWGKTLSFYIPAIDFCRSISSAQMYSPTQ